MTALVGPLVLLLAAELSVVAFGALGACVYVLSD